MSTREEDPKCTVARIELSAILDFIARTLFYRFPSLFYNHPLEFENYFPFCLSAQTKCPFQFTFRRRVFTVNKDICEVFSRIFIPLASFVHCRGNSRKCKEISNELSYFNICHFLIHVHNFIGRSTL